MAKIESYRDLLVWQKAMDLVVRTYQLAKRFPDNERFGLVVQIQRTAISIPSNIAEGHGRRHLGDYLHHLSIANGYLKELETQLMIAEKLSYLQRSELAAILEKAEEIGRMLAGLIQKLRDK